MFTIFVKRWKITSQTYQKYTEFASGCWIRKGVRQKKSLKKLTKLFLLTQQQVMNTYTHHTYVKTFIYTLQRLLNRTQLHL